MLYEVITRSIAEKARQGKIEPSDINEQVISQHLWTRSMPDPDLLIRTSGEQRIRFTMFF